MATCFKRYGGHRGIAELKRQLIRKRKRERIELAKKRDVYNGQTSDAKRGQC